jgi:hypothetical protein
LRKTLRDSGATPAVIAGGVGQRPAHAAGSGVEEATAAPGDQREVQLTPAPGDGGPAEDVSPSVDDPSAKEVRAWAREVGHDVPARGKLPDDLIAAYKRAHGGW